MLWKKESVELAAEDVQAIVNKAVPALEASIGEPIYLTQDESPGLITQSQVRMEVERLLNEATETLDTTTIATRLKLGRPSIDAVILQAIASSESFFDGVHVLPSRRIDAIGDTVLSQSKIVKLSEICNNERITLKAAAYAIKRKSPHLMIVGHEDYVVPEKLLQGRVQQFKAALDEATEPVKYTHIDSDPILLPLVKFQLGIPAHQTDYLPTKYVKSKQDEAEKLLQSTGYVSAATIKTIEEPSKFAKRTQSIVLGQSWVVSQSFVSKQQSQLVSNLNNRGFVDLRDTTLYPQLSKYIVEEADTNLMKFRSAKYPATFLVKPSLERDLLSKVTTELSKKAADEANNLEFNVTGSSTVSDFVSMLELPSLSVVASLIENEDEEIPSELRISDHILPQVRKSYAEVCTKTLRPRVEQAVESLEGKIRCYFNGLLTLPVDSELYSMAWDEWQQYVSEQQFSVPANVEVAKQQFRVSATVLQLTAEDLTSKASNRLEKLKNRPKDAAMILHLASTIYHSKHFCSNEPGFLKLRGKAVPKLLKQFDFPACYDNLRKQLKEPSEDLMIEVRKSL